MTNTKRFIFNKRYAVRTLLLFATVAHLTAQKTTKSLPPPPMFLLLISDTDCQLTIDGDSDTTRSLVNGSPYRLPISVGDHILTCSVQGISRNFELNVSNRDTSQRIVHINLAENLAAAENTRLQEAQTKAAKDREIEDRLLKETAIVTNLSKMTGTWYCSTDVGLLVTDGRVYTSGTAPSASKVLIATNSSLRISFDAIDHETKIASGRAVLSYSSRLANQYEINGYQRHDRFQLSMVNPPACYNSNHNSCLISSDSKTSYDLDSVGEATEDRLTLVLGSGKCAGNCPDDRVISSGKKLKFTFKKDHPGFFWDGNSCRQQ